MEKLIEVLRKRANEFLKVAETDFKEGRYELCAFHAEQSLQLSLKAKILEFGIEFPKIHSVKELLTILSKLSKSKSFKELAKKEEIKKLDESYLSSRYFPVSISKKEAYQLLKFVKKVRKLIK